SSAAKPSRPRSARIWSSSSTHSDRRGYAAAGRVRKILPAAPAARRGGADPSDAPGRGRRSPCVPGGRMKLLHAAVAGRLVPGPAAAGRADEKPADKDTDYYARKAVGSWEVTEGESLDPGSTLELTRDGKITLVVKRGGQELTVKGTYKIKG